MPVQPLWPGRMDPPRTLDVQPEPRTVGRLGGTAAAVLPTLGPPSTGACRAPRAALRRCPQGRARHPPQVALAAGR